MRTVLRTIAQRLPDFIINRSLRLQRLQLAETVRVVYVPHDHPLSFRCIHCQNPVIRRSRQGWLVELMRDQTCLLQADVTNTQCHHCREYTPVPRLCDNEALALQAAAQILPNVDYQAEAFVCAVSPPRIA